MSLRYNFLTSCRFYVFTKKNPEQIDISEINNEREQDTGRSEPRDAGNNGLGSSQGLLIQLSSSHGKKATTTFNSAPTFDDLQEAVVTKFGITKDRQKLQYGFPRQELRPPGIANEVLPLRHRDNVFVDTFQDVNAMVPDNKFTGE